MRGEQGVGARTLDTGLCFYSKFLLSRHKLPHHTPLFQRRVRLRNKTMTSYHAHTCYHTHNYWVYSNQGWSNCTFSSELGCSSCRSHVRDNKRQPEPKLNAINSICKHLPFTCQEATVLTLILSVSKFFCNYTVFSLKYGWRLQECD